MKTKRKYVDATSKRNKETSNIVRYFLHGVPLAFVSMIFMYILSFSLTLVAYDDISEFMGFLLIMGGVYLVITGGVNTITTNMVWKIRTKSSILSLLGQGFLFTVILSLVNPFLYIFVFTSAATLILNVILIFLTFAILAPILGYIGRNVAAEFVGDRYESDELASVHDRQVVCPYCGAQQLVGPPRLMHPEVLDAQNVAIGFK